MKLRDSITTRMIVVLGAPLLVQLILLLWTLEIAKDITRDWESESRCVEALVHVNQILNEVLTLGASFATFKGANDPSFLVEAQLSYTNLEKHCEQLRRIAAEDPAKNSEIQGFVNVINEGDEIFEQVAENSMDDTFEYSMLRMAAKYRTFLRRVETSGRKVTDQAVSDRKSYIEQQGLHRTKLEWIFGLSMFTTFIVALAGAAYFGLKVGRRLQYLNENTLQLAMGKELRPVVGGNDEIAILDLAFHNLADQLEISRQRERALIENTAEMIGSLDKSLRVAEINPAVEKHLGYKAEEFRGSLFLSYVEAADRDHVFKCLEECVAVPETEMTFEASFKTLNNRLCTMEVANQWSAENNSHFFVARDITAKKEAERLKQEVLTMISHDLRAPLTSLGLTLEMFLEGIAGELNERGTRLATMSLDSVSYLISMINDLLDIERFEADGMKLIYETVDARGLLARAVETVEPELDKKELEINVECDNFSFQADGERLLRVVINLLNNAIKFSPERKQITIKCEPESADEGPSNGVSAETKRGDRGRDGTVRFSISDQGPGIPAEKISSIFEKFQQVGTGCEGERRGSGLGLAICRVICEAHDGKIWVESTAGSGSTFIFTIPVVKPIETGVAHD